MGDALIRPAPLVLAALLLASCSSGWIEPSAQRPSLDEHCILHSIAELDARSDRLISQARSAANIELQRAAETMAFDRAQRRTSLDRWLQHKEGDHALIISTCPATSMPMMPRGARADAALLAALIETRECGMELVQLDRCSGERTTTHALVSAIGASYRRELLVLRAAAVTAGQ